MDLIHNLVFEKAMSYIMSKTSGKPLSDDKNEENDPADMVRFAIHELSEKFSGEPSAEKIITILQVRHPVSVFLHSSLSLLLTREWKITL